MTTKWWVVVGVMLGGAGALPGQTTPTGAPVVYVQDSPAAAEMLAAAQDRLTKDEPEEAAKLIQQVLEQHAQKLLPTREGQYAEARYAAAKVLLDHPRLLAAYRQMYEPAAAKALQEAGEDPAKLESVLSRYELTDSGLAAGLKIAGLSLEAGEADAAAIVLSHLAHHPSLSKQAALWQELRGSAAALMNQPGTVKEARAALVKAKQPDAAAELDRLSATLHHPAAQRAFTALDTLKPTDVPPVASSPLWSVGMDGAEQYLLDSYQVDRQQIDSLAKDGRFLNLMPTVWGQSVFINDGQTLHAVDLSSGRTLWERRLMDSNDDAQGLGRTFGGRWLPQGMDLNVAAVSSGRVVAVIGYSAMVTISPYYRTTNFSQLACVNAKTGQVEWTLNPDSIAEDFSDAFWYGRPIVSDGRVYATLRRRQRTQFQDAYVVAVDLRKGKIDWMRHLGSTAITNKPLSGLDHMLLEGGWLYVDSRIGSVAKLSAVDGSVQWLTLAPIDDQRADEEPRPWQTTAPVLVDGGLIVLDRASQVVRVFNPETGQVTDTIPAERWNNPNYLQRVGGDVLAVGPTLDRLDGKTLVSLWTYKPSGTIRGRGAVAGDRMYLPAGDGMDVVDLATGRLADKLSIPTPANVVVLPGQILAAHRKSVANYSTWEVASAMLRQQMQQSPQDPRPLMKLAWLALGTGRQAELTDAVDKAIHLATTSPEANHETSREMFTQLLEMAKDGRVKDAAIRRTLFDRMAAVADGPDQEVTYRLALASFQEDAGQFADAVQQYQMILGEPSYRRQLYVHESGSRQAGLEAQRRLKDLLAKHGPQLYANYDAYAAARLAQLKLEADPQPLIDLAESYPLSSVAPEAMLLAASRTADRGNAREAVGLYRRAAQSTRDPKLIAAIYGQNVELLIHTSQGTRARRLLRQLMASFPGVKPLRAGQPVDPQQWMSELAALPQAQPASRRLSPPLSGPSRVLLGTLMRPQVTDPDDAGPDVVPILGAGFVQMLRGTDLGSMWRHDVTGRPDLLALDRSRMFLWDGPQQAIQVLDTATGQVRWEDRNVKRKLDAIKAPEVARSNPEAQVQRLANGGVILLGRQARQRTETEPMAAVSDVAVAIADERGRVVVYSPESGKILWQGSTPVRNASQLLVEGRYLILAGNDEDDAPLLCVYDAQTGVLVHRLLNSKKQAVMWAGVDDTGQLIYVSATQIEAFDLNRGQATWVCKPGVQLGGENGVWIGGDRLVVQTRDDDLIWIDLAEGRVVSRQPIRGTIRGPFRVVSDAEGWLVVGSDHCMATNNDGVPQWHDALNDSNEVLAWDLADKHVVLLVRPGDPNSAGHLYLLDRQGGAVRYEDEIVSNRPIEDVNVASGRLMLSGSGSTAVLESSSK